MSAIVVAALDQIAADWSALTPTDRPSITYHELGTRGRQKGTAGDRGFAFDILSFSTEAQHEGGSQVLWSVRAEVRLTQAGRSQATLPRVAATEAMALHAAIEAREVWPSGVLEVVTEEPEITRDGDTGDVLIELAMSILCDE